MAKPSNSGQAHPMEQQFREKVEELTLRNPDSSFFILVDSLIEWFTEEIISKLMAEMVKQRHPETINAAGVYKSRYLCLVFSILLEIRHAHLLPMFKPDSETTSLDGITDDKLRDAFAKYRTIEGEKLPADDQSEFTENFNFCKRRYVVPKFIYDATPSWQSNIVLPIIESKSIRRGAFGHLYQIKVPEEFVDISLREFIEPPELHGSISCYSFALKTQQSKRSHQAETDAFRINPRNPDMVTYLCQFTQKYSNSEAKHQRDYRSGVSNNILLELGKGDLWNYFQQFMPPIFPSEIMAFWKIMARIVKGVANFHEFEYRDSEGIHEYYGLHNDIKLQNIIIVYDSKAAKSESPGGGEWRFKLADLGLAHYLNKADWKRENGSEPPRFDGIELGTVDYTAPEVGLRNSARGPVTVRREIDIWSLGCVLSQAASWVVNGVQALEQFRRLRLKAIGNGLDDAAPFHDNGKVLSQIQDWHSYLAKVKRPTDNITTEILEVVSEDMLLDDPSDRKSAQEIWKKLESILEKDSGDDSHLPEAILEHLVQIDADIAEKSTQNTSFESSTDNLSDDSPKSSRSSGRLKLFQTSNRSTLKPMQDSQGQSRAPNPPGANRTHSRAGSFETRPTSGHRGSNLPLVSGAQSQLGASITEESTEHLDSMAPSSSSDRRTPYFKTEKVINECSSTDDIYDITLKALGSPDCRELIKIRDIHDRTLLDLVIQFGRKNNPNQKKVALGLIKLGAKFNLIEAKDRTEYERLKKLT